MSNPFEGGIMVSPGSSGGGGGGAVDSVNGQTGVVVLTSNDVGALPASDAGTIVGLAAPAISDLAATTAVPHGPAPFEYNFYKELSGDLTLTDDGTPNEGDGYRLVLYRDTTARLITIPSSYSEAQGGNITTFYVQPNQDRTIIRQYINGGWRVYGDPSPQPYTPGIMAQRGLGGGGVYETMPIYLATTLVALSSGNLSLVAIDVSNTSTFTGVRWFQTSNSNFVANNNNKVGLYSYSAGDLTLIASSASANNMWDNGQNTWQVRAFSSPVTVNPGTYFIACLYNSSSQTTGPSIAGAAAAINATIMTPADLTNSAKLACTLSGQTDLVAGPVAISTFTASTATRYFRLYT
jgi:hypothetical protein